MNNKIITPGYFGNNAYADQRRYEFDIKNETLVTNKTAVDIVFIGDSITHYFELNSYFRQYGLIINRGINGDVLEHLSVRFIADAIQLKPKLIILAAGVNNIWPVSDLIEQNVSMDIVDKLAIKNLEFMKKEYMKIIEIVKKHQQKIFIAAIIPTRKGEFINKYIIKINEIIKKLCEKDNIVYVDYHQSMVKKDGLTLKDNLDVDTLHPNVNGYNIMAEVLTEYLEKSGVF